MRYTFGRLVLERLGCGSLNWEDDVAIIDEMVEKKYAEPLRKMAAERNALEAALTILTMEEKE